MSYDTTGKKTTIDNKFCIILQPIQHLLKYLLATNLHFKLDIKIVHYI